MTEPVTTNLYQAPDAVSTISRVLTAISNPVSSNTSRLAASCGNEKGSVMELIPGVTTLSFRILELVLQVGPHFSTIFAGRRRFRFLYISIGFSYSRRICCPHFRIGLSEGTRFYCANFATVKMRTSFRQEFKRQLRHDNTNHKK